MSTTPISSTYLSRQQRISAGSLSTVRVSGQIKICREDLDSPAMTSQRTPARDIITAVEEVVADAPPLTSEQRERLAVILGGGC